jgi:hypothetical protein
MSGPIETFLTNLSIKSILLLTSFATLLEVSTTNTTSTEPGRQSVYHKVNVREYRRIGPDMFQVAVLTYNVEPTVLFDLDDHTKEEDIK